MADYQTFSCYRDNKCCYQNYLPKIITNVQSQILRHLPYTYHHIGHTIPEMPLPLFYICHVLHLCTSFHYSVLLLKFFIFVVELYDIFSSNSFPSTTSQSSLYQANLEFLVLLLNQTFWNP